MKKYRNYETPDGWNYAMSYADVMRLRLAYNAGVKTEETREAARIYINWMRIKRESKK